MSFLDNIKMGPKLIGSYLVLAVVAAIIGGVGVREIRAIDAADTILYEKMTVPLSEMGDIMQLFQRQRVNLRDAILTGDVERYGKRIKEIDAESNKVEDSFVKSLLTEKGQAGWKTYKEAATAYDGISDKVLKLVEQGKPK